MSEKKEKLNNIKSQTVTKNVRLNEHVWGGGSLSLAPKPVAPRIVPASSADSLRFVGLSATPSPRGSAPKTPIRLATVFSGIGAIEHALDRMNLNHKIIFACDNGDLEI